MKSERTRLLFLCSRNKWRSPTAEQMFRGDQAYEARSAGVRKQARKVVNESMLRWADWIFVMERKHLQILRAKFSRIIEYKTIVCLDIPDDYSFMDPDLIELLGEKLAAYLTEEA